MHVTNIYLNKYRAIVENSSRSLDLGTNDSKGNEKLNIIRGDGWEDLTIKITFWPSRVEMYVPDDGLVDVPPEATNFECPPFRGKVIFNGVSNGRVINTTDLTYSVSPHVPSRGVDTSYRTPSVWEQWVDDAKSTVESAESAVEDVNNSIENVNISIKEVDRLKEEYEELIANTPINPDWTLDHTKLTHRDAENQHPISAIEGLEKQLDTYVTSSNTMSNSDIDNLLGW